MPSEFSEAALKELNDEILPHYPNKQAALVMTLRLAEREFGEIDNDAMLAVADALDLSPAHVLGVVSFYSHFRVPGQGKVVIDVCATLPCALRGSDTIIAYLCEKLGIQPGETTEDGMFTLRKVECLGACDMAPMMQVGEDYYGPLTTDMIDELLEEFRRRAETGEGAPTR